MADSVFESVLLLSAYFEKKKSGSRLHNEV